MTGLFKCNNCEGTTQQLATILTMELNITLVQSHGEYMLKKIHVARIHIEDDLGIMEVQCPNCKHRGQVSKEFTLVFVCYGCDKVVVNGGMCTYDGRAFCKACYASRALQCKGCPEQLRCVLYKHHRPKKKRYNRA